MRANTWSSRTGPRRDYTTRSTPPCISIRIFLRYVLVVYRILAYKELVRQDVPLSFLFYGDRTRRYASLIAISKWRASTPGRRNTNPLRNAIMPPGEESPIDRSIDL